MSATPGSNATARSWWSSAPGLLLLFGLASAAVAWWIIALPVLTLANVDKHPGHFPLTFLHMVCGTIMLVFGALNLYIGATRRHFRFHRQVGYIYLVGGTIGASVALLLALATVHGKYIAPFAFDLTKVSDLGFGLAALAVAWLGCAAMGFRAARNRRFESHRAWMIRSYVLAWSFVSCRLIGHFPALAWLANLGDGTSIIWLSWLVPLSVAEIALQWNSGAALAPRNR